jgi:apolipoprotein N-acyltransferase
VPAHYGGLSPFLSFLVFLTLILFLALFWAFFSLCVSLIRHKYPQLIYLLIPFIWVAFEYLITHVLTGFPWGLLGHSQVPNTWFIQTAAVTGVYGVSFLLVFLQSFFLASLSFKKKGPFFSALALILAVHLAGFLSMKDIPEDGTSFTASVIQGNVSSDIYWDRIEESEIRRIFEEHIQLSRQAVSQGAELIIWPEFSVTLCFSCPYGYYLDFKDGLFDFVRETNTTLVLGTNEQTLGPEETQYHNTALTLHPDLSMSQYYKMHLVPFGEYTPYKKVFSFIKKMTHAIGDITPGKSHRLHEYSGLSFGSPICYEIIFPDLVRRFTKKGAHFLVTITNDGWYGTSAAPYQHFAMAVFRAVENRRFLLRAATTGISGIVDPYGRVISQTEMETQTLRTKKIKPFHKTTIYARFGDVLSFLSLTLGAVFLILSILKNSKKRNKK